MFASSSTGLLAVLPVYSTDATASSFYVYNPNTQDFTSFEVPKNVTAAAEAAQHKYTAPEVSKELQEDNAQGSGKKAENKMPSVVVRSVTFSEDSKYIVAATDGHLILVYTVEDAKLIAYIPTSRKATVVKMSPDHRFIVFSDRLGDIYAVKFELLIAGQPVESNLLYSQANTITALDFMTIDGKPCFISADQENQIRVSNYPDFFVIENCLMAHKAAVTTLDVLPGARPLVLSSSSVMPIISHLAKGEVVSDSFKTHTVQLALWDATQDKPLQTIMVDTPAQVAIADEDKFLSQFTSSARIGSHVYYAVAAVGCAKRPNKTDYAYGSTLTAHGPLSTLLCASVEGSAVSVAAVEDKSEVSCNDNIVALHAHGDMLYALTANNNLCVIAVDGKTLNRTKCVKVPAAAVTKAALSVGNEVQVRSIESFIKHELLFAKAQDHAREKRRKRNDGLAVSDSEEEDIE